jgi:hypothetical protein
MTSTCQTAIMVYRMVKGNQVVRCLTSSTCSSTGCSLVNMMVPSSSVSVSTCPISSVLNTRPIAKSNFTLLQNGLSLSLSRLLSTAAAATVVEDDDPSLSSSSTSTSSGSRPRRRTLETKDPIILVRCGTTTVLFV